MEKFDYLTLDDILDIGQSLIPNMQVRDLGLLESASLRPQMSIYGKDAYPSFSEKLAALMHSLARNHALVDGNKRLTWSSGRIFCLMNGRDLRMEIDEAEALIHAISKGELGVAEIGLLLQSHIRKLG